MKGITSARVAVNIHPRHVILRANFVATIRAMLEKAWAARRQLELEKSPKAYCFISRPCVGDVQQAKGDGP